MSEIKMVMVQNKDVNAVIQGLAKLATMSIPVQLVLKVRRLMRSMRTEIEDIEAVKKELAERYCQHDEKGRLIMDETKGYPFIDVEAGEQYQAGYDELMKAETEAVPVIAWMEFGAKLTDEKRTDHEEPAGLATILILLGELFEE